MGAIIVVQAREGCTVYLTPWNRLGIVSSGLLLVGSACHFATVKDGVRTAGAMGVALKCFGLVDYLRSSPATGSLVRMVSVRLCTLPDTLFELAKQLRAPYSPGAVMANVTAAITGDCDGYGSIHDDFIIRNAWINNVLHDQPAI